MTKILLIIMSEEEEKIRMPLSFAKNQIQNRNEIRIVFWGPSEKTLADNETLQESYRSLSTIKPKACENTAKAHGLVEKLSKNLELMPVGGYIAKSIEEGYEVITF
ncbi:MAG: DsrE family protein [Thermoplasmata archaeon]